MTFINTFFPFGLFIAMVTGLLGATFFMLIQLQGRISEGGLTDARDMWTYRMIFLRCFVGIGAASILYFFFKSGLLDGSLWPDLHEMGFDSVSPKGIKASKTDVTFYVPNQSFALLVVWSFIAGYSQTLVPDLLATTESRSSNRSGS